MVSVVSDASSWLMNISKNKDGCFEIIPWSGKWCTTYLNLADDCYPTFFTYQRP
jgi:hypothetical protein